MIILLKKDIKMNKNQSNRFHFTYSKFIKTLRSNCFRIIVY